VAPDLPAMLQGDVLRIEQILLNLATNAVKFTARGRITLSAQRTDGGVMFSVADTGPGIPEASRSRLFQRFEQGDGPQRRAGSGLGLAICRELVTLMGGSIELESRLGQGSTFRVRLPLAELAPAAPLVTAAAAGVGARHVLLVEDDTTVAAVIRGLLARQGHRVTHVADGLGALAELDGGPYDVLLLDLDLPGVDGFQLARLLRQREGDGVRLPIVAITARSGGDEELRAREAGMDGFLRKPLSGDQLAKAMETAIAAAGLPA
jgi:CheY-like chemotaxis protein